jgi:uncharacterized membrane protein
LRFGAGRRRLSDRSSPLVADAGRARALGWFSIGLGAAEVAAPAAVAGLAGLADGRRVLRAFGMREIASGLGILVRPRPAGWLWARVAGDVLDLAFLGGALAAPGARRRRAVAATAAVAGVTALDVACAIRLGRAARALPAETIRVTKSITINRTPEDLYRYWRDLENLPRFMQHLEAVRVTGGTRSHWVVKGPGGVNVEWDAEIGEDRPNEMISWRSLDGDVSSAGTVRFARPANGRGTTVTVQMQYRPPGGTAGAFVATLFGKEPGRQVEENHRRLKQLLEAGEIATTEGSPSARASRSNR